MEVYIGDIKEVYKVWGEIEIKFERDWKGGGGGIFLIIL